MIEVGATYDPIYDELYAAQRGQGAYLNGERLQVSVAPTLDKALLVTGFPYDRRTNPHNNIRQFADFSLRAQGVLRLGSAALDLGAVAAGRLDGYWEFKINPWDIAAGVLMVTEAGGQVTAPTVHPRSVCAPGSGEQRPHSSGDARSISAQPTVADVRRDNILPYNGLQR